MVVVNDFGHFILMEDGHLFATDRNILCMLLDIETTYGLPDEFKVILEGGLFVQRLDY